MQSHNKQSVIISILVHVGFVSMAVLVLVLERWLEDPEPLVFELVAEAGPQAVEQPREQPMEEEVPLEPLEVPDIPDPIEPIPDVPDLPEPEPEPEPPKPEPEPEKPKLISADDFFKNRDRPEPVQRVEKPRKKPVVTPELKTDIRDRLKKTISDIKIEGPTIGIQSNDELLIYLSALRRQIEAAFEPRGAQLEAEVYFTVSATGRILNPSINRSSGDTAFDQSVIRTMRATQTPGPPPGNRAYSFSLVFRSR
jgi:TonB family protein